MGVVNVTPDSFSDGGVYLDEDAAVAHGVALVAAGADIVDVGGEATNPRARPVEADEELRRVLPVVRRLVAAGATVSIDTTKASVAAQAVAAGATFINDVSGGRFDADMARVVAATNAVYIAGHLRADTLTEVFQMEASPTPITWQTVATELAERIAGLPADRVWVDPGLGFGKGADPEVNLALIRHAGDLGRALGRPVVVGPSRKRFLRRMVEVGGVSPGPEAVDAASVAACLAASRAGAHALRIHNVALLRPALTVYTRT
jgi:dihydropteroate synthase